jgi:hypothetical protein
MRDHRNISFVVALGSLALACQSQPSPIVRAAGVERSECDASRTSQTEVELLQTTQVLQAGPLYGHIFDANHANESQMIIGAKLLVRPPAGVRPDELARILQCHRARVVLGEESAAQFPDDPYWLPDAWVDIDVNSENGNYAVLLSSDKVRYNLELVTRAKRYASEHMLGARPEVAAPSGASATAASVAPGVAQDCGGSGRASVPSSAGLDVPADGSVVLFHASASGTQNYACVRRGDGATEWTLVGPTATLTDCRGTLAGRHFASARGSAYPEWQTTDGSYVVAKKTAAWRPEGGVASVPWLLLEAVDAGGPGPLGRTSYVQRVHTSGGVPPGGCKEGDATEVPYTAEYFFYGR